MRIVLALNDHLASLFPHSRFQLPSLMKLAGQPVFHWLLLELDHATENKIEEVVIIGHSLAEAQKQEFEQIISRYSARAILLDAPGDETGWEVFARAAHLEPMPSIYLFSNSLFRAENRLGVTTESAVLVHHSDNPEKHMVARLDVKNTIVGIASKAREAVSNLAIHPVLYLKDPSVMPGLLSSGSGAPTSFKDVLKALFKQQNVQPLLLKKWIGFENIQEFLDAHQHYIASIDHAQMIEASARAEDTVIVGPVYLGKNVKVTHSVIGPYVSIEEGCEIHGSVLRNTIVGKHCVIRNVVASQSVFGREAQFRGKAKSVNLGDFSKIAF